MQRQRIEHEPAYVLHSRPFGDTSLLVEVFTAGHGRLGVLAKGARSAKSKKRALLQVLQPLLLSWTERGELGTLTAIEAASSAISLGGESLFCAWYANELLMKLLPRGGQHPQLFVAYSNLLPRLQADPEPALRQFECTLLDELGFGLGLDSYELQASGHYCFANGLGLRPALPDEPGAIRGATLLALRDDRLLAASERQEARRLLRGVLHELLGGRALESAQLLRALRGMPAS